MIQSLTETVIPPLSNLTEEKHIVLHVIDTMFLSA